MHKLVLLRHGESEWNKLNLFSGWMDINLSDDGVKESREAGKLIREAGYSFDIAYTSLLRRAIRTLWIVQEEIDQMWIPVVASWHLNERHYGALQGLNKLEMIEKYGQDKVQAWRRSYDVRPPALKRGDERDPARDPRYRNLKPEEIPLTESLEDTVKRTLPFWHETIASSIRTGKKVLIVAHGNSLRVLVKYLDNISNEEIVKVNIPTGIPLVYELDENLKPLKEYYYLGDQEAAKAKAAAWSTLGGKLK